MDHRRAGDLGIAVAVFCIDQPEAPAVRTCDLRTLFAQCFACISRETAMSDSKLKVGKPDRDRVDPNDPSEVNRVATKFNTSSALVLEAVKRVGPMRADVERELAKRGKN